MLQGIIGLIVIAFYCWFRNVDGAAAKFGVFVVFLVVCGIGSWIMSETDSTSTSNDDYEYYDSDDNSNVSFKGKPGSRITINGKTRYFDGTDFWWEGPGCEYCSCDEYYHMGENAGECSNCPHSGAAHHD